MKITRILLLATLLTSTVTFSQNGEKNFIDQPYIEVTGEIETEVIPDEIYLNITINENDKKGKVSVEEQENQMISVLKSLKINLDKDFSILDFDGFFQRKFLATNEMTKTKRYELIVHDGKTLAMVFEALDRIDISNISIVKTDHSDIENIKRETKLKALKVAKEKAGDYAKAIDQTLGKALFIQEFNNNIYMPSVANAIMLKGANRESADMEFENLNFKPITIKATVLTRFALN
ncbi:SIMPL domain-containing protein [Flavobacteriaceae bacterium XHP0103]|uniref:SIMPL domain-containing protein n=1 Tax=Marixanthotalea marina TaxID=2844359 RepID=UPI002989F791|nr:SIMPL domain-containing protein [Marixanthotalea marina]MBU3821995.1 SIMPL domain-containing protein [Marixanthotalea marina]